MIAFTIVARNYLSLAYTLAESYARHHEGSVLIIVADGLDGVTSPAGVRVEAASAHMDTAEFEDLALKYNITEFCTAVKPYVFKTLFARHPGAKITYLDPDTYVMAPLDYVEQALEARDIVLTPHLLECRVEHDHSYPEYKHLWEGIFNLGFAALKDSPAAHKLVDWWIVRLRDFCYADRWDGLHTDQKWMDYVPGYFPGQLHVSTHAGLNVAHWNLDERPLSRRDGAYWAGNAPLLLFHFSGCDFQGRRVTKYVTPSIQARFGGEAVNELVQQYVDAVIRNGYQRTIVTPYKFNFFDDGTAITSLHRRLYRTLNPEHHFKNVLSAQGAFYQLLAARGMLDRSEQAARNYTAATVSNLDHKRKAAESVMRLLWRLVGPRKYSYLIKFFSIYGRFESHAFLLDEKSARTNH
jgi:hypothetical protein